MIVIDQNDCSACGMCYEECANGAIQVKESSGGYAGYEINQDSCVQCGFCLDFDCPGNAIKEVEK